MTNQDISIIFSRNIRNERLKKQYTQEILAERAGITPEYLARLECGRHNPSLKIAFQIAQALGVTLDTLIPPEGHYK